MFCCFTTKAVHVELIINLPSNGFLSTLTRFVSHRGTCTVIYFDNATNFVGADNQLQNISRLINRDTFQAHLSKLQINCHFLPAHPCILADSGKLGLNPIKII